MHTSPNIIFIPLFFFGCNSQKEPPSGSQDLYTGTKFTEHIRSTAARTPEEERQGFKLPEGFEIQLYASEPDIGKPLNIAFDAQGRLWVTQSHEYPFPAEPGEGADKLTILEDTDHDGKADKFTHFDDTLNIPIGVLPITNSVITYSIPNLYSIEDTDGDGKANQSRTLYGPFGHRDTHGMVNNLTSGYDGWIYVCHGFTNTSTIAGTDGDSITMTSGNTFRIKPDGSRVEQVSFGQVNPFGLTFDEYGYVYATDCHSSPIYQLIRGADYPHFGKKEVGIGFAPDTKPHGEESTALSGIAYYAANQFPEEYQKNFFIGDVVTCRVHRNSFEFKGSTPVAKAETDLVKSEDPWFRPVDIKVGPDGALYVADFYNSIIGHYEVPLDHPKRDKLRGRIWRITYVGENSEQEQLPKNLASASVNELIASLQDGNLPNRMKAADQLVDRIGQEAVMPVKAMLANKETKAIPYAHGLWILDRLQALEMDQLSQAARHADPVVRVHTMRIIKEKNGENLAFYPLIEEALTDADYHVRRAAVEALATYKDLNTIEWLVGQKEKVPDYDTHYLYTVRLALRNLLKEESLIQQVIAKNWKNGEMGTLADVMTGVENADAGSFLFSYIKENKVPAKQTAKMMGHAARFIPVSQLNLVIDAAKNQSEKDMQVEFLTFTAIRQGLEQRGEKPSAQFRQWGEQVASHILEKYPVNTSTKTEGEGAEIAKNEMIDQLKLAIETVGNFGINQLEPQIELWLRQEDADQGVKLAAAKTLLQIAPEKNAKPITAILQDEGQPIAFKKQIVGALSDLPAKTSFTILAGLDNWPPDLQADVAKALAGSAAGKDLLLEKVKNGVIFPRTLVQPQVEERLLLNISKAQAAELKRLTADLPSISDEKEQLINQRLVELQPADSIVASGKILFTQHCSPCHRINEEGGMIGPQLTGIGNWGAKALTEKILDPNRNISGSFRNYTIKLKDGKVMTGLYRRDEGEMAVFANVAGQEFSLEKDNIAEQTPSAYTLMPDNFGERLNQKEFNALLSFLLDQQPEI